MTISPIHELFKSLADAVLQIPEQNSQEVWQRAVTIVVESKKPIVTIGVGKSGNIAQKIASTLASTGTRSHFIHASDAFHGDLGRVDENSVALIFSASGETQEVLDILPSLTRMHVKIISFTGNLNSTLAQKSDVVINCHVAKEICPLNLAPTTSTTVSLAAADVLAMLVMQKKNISKTDFALNHPKGSLGKRLTLKVSDIMVQAPLADLDMSFVSLIEKITSGGVGAVIIVDRDQKMEGIITDGDVRRFLQKNPVDVLKTAKSRDLVTKNPITSFPDMLASDALQQMEFAKSPITSLPVIDKQTKVLGLVRLHDIVQKGII